MSPSDLLTVGIAQIAPVWLDREATTERVVDQIREAGAAGCALVAFGEAFVPGYPFWISLTDGGRFESDVQKDYHAHYVSQAVCIGDGHLDEVCRAAAEARVAVYLGIIERDRGRGQSLFASLVYVDARGAIGSVHRKLMPTYEERLSWAPGDGHGLRVHRLGAFTAGGLNCWENWMPLARAALYGQGTDLHVAVWPGSVRNTHDITRFIARENRCFCLSAAPPLRAADVGPDVPHRDLLLASTQSDYADGGSCIAGPDGEWVVAPVEGEVGLIVAQIDHRQVRRERQNFEPGGHYSRPDVTRLVVNRERQSTVELQESTRRRE
jgi:nitrilase